MATFTQRVYGAVIIKSLDSNFNADFTHSPRTLPDGTVYATDKALKYAVRSLLVREYGDKEVFYFKRFNDNFNPLTLNETYRRLFGEFPKKLSVIEEDDADESSEDDNAKKSKKPKKSKTPKEITDKIGVVSRLLSCLDIRLFGATYADPKEKISISVHGPVQVNHAINRFVQNEIYSEQIMSPFRNPSKKKDENNEGETKEKEASTLGSQTNLREGHYVFHVTVNPKNIAEITKAAGHDGISTEDISKLKTSLTCGVTALDSSRKIGSENEALLWVTLKEGSTKHLPNFTELISIKIDATNPEKRVIHCERVSEILRRVTDEIESIELHYNPTTTNVAGLESLRVSTFDIISGQAIQ